MKKLFFVGNPNTGKTALINAIAKSDLEVGNWPGVTVEKKEAKINYKNEEIILVDLPGTYTLTPYSLEENITVNALFNERYDGIINVIDATNLRRNLYLTLELIDMQTPMVVAFNMYDDFIKRGYKINKKLLEEILGVCIVETVAVRGLGASKVLECAVKAVEKKQVPKIQPYQEHIEKEIVFLIKHIKNIKLPKRFFALKLLENDPNIVKIAQKAGELELLQMAKDARERIEKHMGLPIKTIIIHSRYDVIDKILKKVLKKPLVDKILLTEKIDNILLHKYLGIPMFFIIMAVMFKFTFDGSSALVEWTLNFFQNFVGKYTEYFIQSFAPEWVVSLIRDGIISGVGLILSFLPLLFFLYFFMALLEESGYMARVSFLLDRVARGIGLKGNAFISMIIGFGCNVSAVYSTRTLTSFKERIITILIIPFMSCSARLPIYALFTALFFKSYQILIIILLYITGIAVAFIYAFLLNKLLPSSNSKPFLLELPTYHMPSLKAVWKLMWPKLKDFIIKAGSVILAASIILWAVINLPVNSTPQNSYLAKSAKIITPVFKPAGFGDNWELVAALIPGTIAKEVVISSLGTIYGVESERQKSQYSFENDLINQIVSLKSAIIESLRGIFTFSDKENENNNVIKEKLISAFPSKAAVLSYLVFVLLYIPCISTMAAIKQELGIKWMVFEMVLLPIIAYIFSILVYQILIKFF